MALETEVQATVADIQELLRANPLAAQQLQAITWQRRASELEAQLVAEQAKNHNGSKEVKNGNRSRSIASSRLE